MTIPARDEPRTSQRRMRLVRTALAVRTDADPVTSDEPDLVAALSRGEQSALAAIYDAHGRACYGLARRILGDDGLAQDVVQEVFLGLWRRPEGFDPERGRLSTWLLTVTHHRAVDAVRREQSHRGRRQTLDVLERVADDRAGPDETAEITERAHDTRTALRALSAPQREALVLAYYGGLTQREIAARLDVPLGTVKTRMFAGMARLRGLLGEHMTLAEGDGA